MIFLVLSAGCNRVSCQTFGSTAELQALLQQFAQGSPLAEAHRYRNELEGRLLAALGSRVSDWPFRELRGIRRLRPT